MAGIGAGMRSLESRFPGAASALKTPPLPRPYFVTSLIQGMQTSV